MARIPATAQTRAVVANAQTSMKHFFRIILLTALVSCSTHPDDFAINIEIHYPFHPWDKFSISKVTDSTTFQYMKLYIEMDSIYYLDADKRTTFKKLIQRRDQETFIIKTLKTDSLIYPNPSDIEFIKDTVKNVIIISEGKEKTKWTLIDSIVVPEFMMKMNKKNKSSRHSEHLQLGSSNQIKT